MNAPQDPRSPRFPSEAAATASALAESLDAHSDQSFLTPQEKDGFQHLADDARQIHDRLAPASGKPNPLQKGTSKMNDSTRISRQDLSDAIDILAIREKPDDIEMEAALHLRSTKAEIDGLRRSLRRNLFWQSLATSVLAAILALAILAMLHLGT